MKGRVLIIAGSDSGGGAGIQADIKAVTALNAYAATAITAITVQNTLGVSDVFAIPTKVIQAQMEAVLSDIGADCLKTGMLSQSDVIETVASTIRHHAPHVPLVVDPVMVAKGGASLLAKEATMALIEELLPLASLITPNAPEAEALTGMKIESPADFGPVAERLAQMGAKAVLLKGGHVLGETVVDLLYMGGKTQRFASPRIESNNTHGTGCTLASSIAAGIAQGLALPQAVARARAYVWQAIATAPGYGHGHGPLNHAHTVGEFTGME
ncbi:MAG: bifunctional hydroxymethylpyrimidine kinase/phosphomethylpyrimidine kinase [Alphaproteobacteria bacterium]|nr:bifunctional hydroxymethylpyrimidine kinase/phosphomethylpyrimidine kinase [Alphaproteobacteria bacterium]